MSDQSVDLSQAVWCKSSYSNPSGGNCVEVAKLANAVAVRDSKDPTGPKLIFAIAEWSMFVAASQEF
jgi:hypothetical protein